MKGYVQLLLGIAALLVPSSEAFAQRLIESRAMVKVGDLNGDLSGDVVILRSLFNPQRQSYTLSQIQLVDGRTLGVMHFISPATAGLRDPRAFRIGDIDGDGRDDVAITSAAKSRRRADLVFLYSGATGQLIRKLKLGTGSISVLSITQLGDVNRDGIADLVLGSAQDRPEQRSLRIFCGRTGVQLRRLNTQAKNQFAQSLATIADRDGDGLPEILSGGTPTGNPRGGGYTILSGATLRVLSQERSTDPSVLLGDDVHAGVDINGDGIPEYAVSILVKRVANHLMRIYDGRTGRFLYGIAMPGGFGGSLAGMVRMNSRILDWVSDVDFDCIPEAVVLGDDAQLRLYSGANGRLIRAIASASSFATLSRPTKPYSWLLATSGYNGQRLLDVRSLFGDPLRPFCDD